PTFARHFDLCLGCRACESACPAGVPFGSLLEATRAQLVQQGKATPRRFAERLAFAVFPRPERLGTVLALARAYRRLGLQALLRATGFFRAFPRLGAMDALVPTDTMDGRVAELTPARGARRGRVGVLTGCVQRHLFGDVNRDTVRLLSLAGWDVVVPREQGCCGALDLHAGRLDDFRARARALSAAFPVDVDWIVTNAAGCGSTMREYGHWLPGVPDAERLAGKTRDITQLLVDAELPLGRLDITATYHDACHLAHGQRVRAEPRTLLRRIPGLRLVELADSDLCCGSAGVYNLLEPAMADRLLEMKVDRIRETGARLVVTGNPGCLLQIAKGCRARGVDVELTHPVTLLARAVDAYERTGAVR
ncbi:MAG: (Fe-S)-binding protein, partial [Candidatus Rokubacteria bacterium]|nr:(Fe-S)-binding protein [Candidatus Rokubacteria bacterium]